MSLTVLLNCPGGLELPGQDLYKVLYRPLVGEVLAVQAEWGV
jgi:hypothetical protein